MSENGRNIGKIDNSQDSRRGYVRPDDSRAVKRNGIPVIGRVQSDEERRTGNETPEQRLLRLRLGI